jgi:hypothetical protein
LIRRLAGAPIYPLLFAAYPILALFAQNAREVRSVELGVLLTIAVTGAAVVWLVSGLFLRNAAKGALVTAVAILMFYTLGHVVEWSENILWFVHRFWVEKSSVKVPPLWLVVPELLLLCSAAVWIGKWTRSLQGATRFLNILAVVAIALPIAQIWTIKAPDATRAARTATPLARLVPPAGTHKPDIYYIILDGYARHDVMKSHFDFDNTPFLDHLERKGFFIAPNSTANYCQTPLCLSSSLNATYLDELVKGLANDQTALKDLIVQNDVLATLRPLGYQFVTFATGFEPTDHPGADVYLAAHPYTTEFQQMVIDMTPARVIWPDPRQMDPFQRTRERLSYLLDHLPDVARDPRPTFTFAHLLAPHPPMVFGENGEDVGHEHEVFMLFNHRVKGRLEKPEGFRRGYHDQAAYITRRIQETIDRILAESPEPPIIIVQSDHGSELNLDMQSVGNTDLHERMSILNAYYFPGGRYEGLYDSISPVNSFRVMLNTFFGAQLPLLPDRCFFSTWPDPYKFIDVTDVVRPPGATGPGDHRPDNGLDPHDS